MKKPSSPEVIGKLLNNVHMTFGDALHIFTFDIRARSKEHRVNMESEKPKRGTTVIDILGR